MLKLYSSNSLFINFDFKEFSILGIQALIKISIKIIRQMNKVLILLLSIVITIAACKDKASSGEDSSASENPTFNVVNPEGSTATPPATPPTQEPPQNAAGVWHYTCPNGCAGGGGSAAPCPKCGTTLAHNQAYHDGANTTGNAVTPQNGGNFTTPPLGSVNSNPPTPPTQEPPQNAKGVWHFTCPNGCAGGGGSTTPCPKCGTTLVHNQAYHQ